MITKEQKNKKRVRIHDRIRKKLTGTEERPRLSIYRSTAHIYAQIIDDRKGVTLVAASTAEAKSKTGGNLASAKEIGKQIADKAKSKGISKVVFDRGGYLYHGRVKALAEAAREAGLQF
ncbi:MAG TPA: 50S ribosomal protein L18 [Terriglobales bacterium]|jgi:large subunit ribosomal protein L18|nr:50S ribosomal protein L18 [Terriglobales bacterium]